MKAHRAPGDWVWLPSYAGFVQNDGPRRAQICDDGHGPCFICDDKRCREWATLHGEDGQMFCHVSECQMSSEKPPPRTSGERGSDGG